jgi:hypothetical protein
MGKLFTAVTTSALLGVASLAYAGEARACGGGGQHVMSQDTNGDGRVDRAELVSGQRARTQGKLAALDTNKDGYVDQSEREAMRTAHQAERGGPEGRGAEAKKGRDGKRGPEGKGRKGEGHWAQIDADKDGRISSAELESADVEHVNRMLERLDTNGDGAIDATEAAAKKGRGHHGRGMKG